MKPASDRWFPFTIPWNDSTHGTATDASFMNAGVAGQNGRVVVKNGVWVEEKTGKRIRFFGTNLAATAAFPAKTDAEAIAAHLAKLGINLVRMHHLNNGWALDGGTVWKKGKTYLEMDPVQLDKFDYFVAALIRHGIFVNVNLQTARTYLPEMGFPESVSKVPNFQKKLDKTNEKMILLQQQYARDLLDRQNSYLGKKYRDEPGISMIEINNENSLVGWPGESPGAGIAAWPEPFRTEFRDKWNAWLTKKYGNDASLRSAWIGPTTQLGPSITTASKQWSWENQSNGDVKFKQSGGTPTSSPTLEAEINTNPGPDWHVQAHVGGLNLESGKIYTVRFSAKADRPTAFGISSRLDKQDWRFLGLSGTATLGTSLRSYQFTFRVANTEPNHSRVGLVLGLSRGKITVENFQVLPGNAGDQMPEGQSLTERNIEFPPASESQRSWDWAEFLAATEKSFSDRMRTFIRKDLGFEKTNLIDSQIAWGGLTAVSREADSNYADNHAYWNHPTFLDGDWSTKSYRVDRKPLVDALASNHGTLPDLASQRVLGRPYSISEYDHPAPSDFVSEMMPLYATFAAFQDWDAIYTFVYEPTGMANAHEGIVEFFDQNANTAKSAFFPASAIVFRRQLLPVATQTNAVTLSETPWRPNFQASDAWSASGGLPNTLASRIGLAIGKAPIKARTSPEASLKITPGNGGSIYCADAPKVKAVAGFVGGNTVNLHDVSFTFGSFGFNFAGLMLVPIDGDNLEVSGRLLLTLVGRVENSGMEWNAERNSVSDHWGTGPVRAEDVPCTVRLRTSGPRKVYALNPKGERLKEIDARYNGNILTFDTGRANSVWFEIVK